MRRQSLTVVDGGWVACREWLAFPRTAVARSPFDKQVTCRFRISKLDAMKAAAARKRRPAYELWSVVLGRVPPVPGHERKSASGLTRLSRAHACFKGIKRPCGVDDEGGEFLAYVLKPTRFYAYSPDMACPAAQQEVPKDLVFVVYVRLDAPCMPGGTGLKGVVTHWEFVDADPANDKLPSDYGARYVERLW